MEHLFGLAVHTAVLEQMIHHYHDSTPKHIYDVLIVGAGPVGLATAIALFKRGIKNILVIDQAREFRRVGQIVDLLPNGLRAIKHIDPNAYTRILESVASASQANGGNKPSHRSTESPEKPAPSKPLWCERNLQGKTIRSFPTDYQSWFDRYGEGRVSLPWFDLQTLLRNGLPINKVESNQRCVHFKEDDAGVQVDTVSNTAMPFNPFAHWEMLRSNPIQSLENDQRPSSVSNRIYAKLVIAADGINSTIRQVLYEYQGLRDWAKPHYSSFTTMGCFQFEDVPRPIIEDLETRYLQGERIVTLKNDNVPLNSSASETQVILIRLTSSTIGYALTARISLDEVQNCSPAKLRDLGQHLLKEAGFHPVFSEFVGLPAPEKIFYRPYFIHPLHKLKDVPSIWSHGRVVLAGDAAHGMPPFMAQGANQGLEDAAYLGTAIAHLIQEKGLEDKHAITNVFQQYEQIRRPLMEKVQFATFASRQWSQPQWDEFNEMLHRREYPSTITLGEYG